MHLSNSTRCSPNRARPWLWANLLSIDAPIVAVLWQQLFIRTLHVPATKASAITLAATVWLIYASDRVLDAIKVTGHSARHRFYRQHWRTVIPALLAALLLSAWSAFTGIRKPVLHNGIAMLVIVILYFAAVHIAPQFTQRWWPKELVVAIIFSAGSCIQVWTFAPHPAWVWTMPLVLFGVLCWVNCAAIAYWEAGASHPSTQWIGTHLSLVSAAIAAVAILLAGLNYFPPIRPLYLSEGVSAIGFLLLARLSSNISHDGLRVAADAVLCSPLLFLPFV